MVAVVESIEDRGDGAMAATYAAGRNMANRTVRLRAVARHGHLGLVPDVLPLVATSGTVYCSAPSALRYGRFAR